jgi:four helix bundle protein
MNHFKELRVWQKAVDLAVDVYQLVRQFPSEEKYGLSSQVTRSAVAISSNIAEGAGRNTDKDFHHFLGMALGSSYELETQLIIGHRISFVDKITFEATSKSIQEIQKMIFALQKTLKSTKDK